MKTSKWTQRTQLSNFSKDTREDGLLPRREFQKYESYVHCVQNPSITDFVNTLLERGVELKAKEDRLSFDAPEGAITDADIEILRAHKPEILALLRNDVYETARAAFEQQTGHPLPPGLVPMNPATMAEFAARYRALHGDSPARNPDALPADAIGHECFLEFRARRVGKVNDRSLEVWETIAQEISTNWNSNKSTASEVPE
ncbi:MAG TPA: hypothetical protein VF719_03660 [Abditibacteriaceae bacterium]|jgi:hypothetical protein